MTIGYITRNYPPQTEGGAEISLWLLANALAGKGINIKIFVPNDQSKKLIVEGDNPKVYRFPWEKKRPFTLNHPLAQKKFRQSILKTHEKLDVIDAYNFITALPAVSYDLNIPYVVSIRDATPLCDVRAELKPKHHRFLDYFKLRYSYLGPSLRETAYGLFGYSITEKRLNVIRKANFVTYASRALSEIFKSFNPNYEVIYSIAESNEEFDKNPKVGNINFSKDKVFLYAGRLTYGKGAKFLLEIAEKIAEKRTDIKFIFAGTGEFQKDIESTSYKSSIVTLGKQTHDSVLSLMAKARATVVPSVIFEPFPRVALESMSVNTPVIGTNSGGISEAIGNAGIVTEVNFSSLEKAILKLADDDNLLRKLKQETRSQVKKFSTEKITNKVISIYEKVLR